MRPTDADLATSRPSYTPDTTRPPRTVLLVDDERAVRTVARRILEQEGYRVLEARYAVEALGMVEDGERSIHVLLSDVRMPDMTGHELSVLLRRRIPGLRTVLMSGMPGEEVPRHHGAGDAGDFVEKPFSAATLTETVRRVLERRADG